MVVNDVMQPEADRQPPFATRRWLVTLHGMQGTDAEALPSAVVALGQLMLGAPQKAAAPTAAVAAPFEWPNVTAAAEPLAMPAAVVPIAIEAEEPAPEPAAAQDAVVPLAAPAPDAAIQPEPLDTALPAEAAPVQDAIAPRATPAPDAAAPPEPLGAAMPVEAAPEAAPPEPSAPMTTVPVAPAAPAPIAQPEPAAPAPPSPVPAAPPSIATALARLVQSLGAPSQRPPEDQLFSNASELRRFLIELGIFGGELHSTPPGVPVIDAAIMHAMIRKFRPGTVLELGHGGASWVVRHALDANVSGRFISVGPEAPRGLNSVEWHDRRVTDLDAAFLNLRLTHGDMLVIHAAGEAEATHITTRLLPAIKPAIRVQFAGVHLPGAPPRDAPRAMHDAVAAWLPKEPRADWLAATAWHAQHNLRGLEAFLGRRLDMPGDGAWLQLRPG